MLKQVYGNYTEENHKVWTMLYSRIMQMLPESADQSVLEGIKMIGFPSDHLPNFEEINEKIRTFTDWEIVPLEDMVGDKEFIGMLAEKKYPCRTWIRSEKQLESEEDEYDMFHDVIGHTPLLTKPNYCNYLTGLGRLALKYIKNEDAIALLKRVYWHTIQFGLKVSDNSLKIYGAHLLSSKGETIYSLSAGVSKYDLNIEKIMDTPYVKGSFQERYFVINKYEELYNSLHEIEKELVRRIK
ncbi:MAG TPA: phenylalanine 4-monooxygenase [Cytophagaceae bacterium]|jgi:phenylalanine-4-hydroxylase|nr:phenylalanine 4-monooxygenase [Cytophagaceae bacterium]